MATKPLHNKLLEKFEKMNGEKVTYHNLWQEIGEFCYPAQQDFQRYFSIKGTKRRRSIFDLTAESSLDLFASSMIGLVANPASKWVNFQPSDITLLENRDVQLFIDEAQRKVLGVLNNPRTKFYDNLYTALKMIGAFGNALMLSDTDEENIVKFRAESPRNFDFTEDFQGNVREFFLEREYAVELLRERQERDGWEIPTEVLAKDNAEKVKVVRAIVPNPDFKSGGLGFKFAKFHSYYILKKEKKLIHKGFFNLSPAALGRWDMLDQEKWADSPARVALSTVKVVNSADRAMIVAMEKELSPALVVSSEAKFGKLDTSAGAVNVGRGNVNDMLREMKTTGNVAQAFQWIESKRTQIRTAFYTDIFQTAETMNMTATEASIRNQERLRTVAPKAAKIQSDLLGPMVERVLSVLISRGDIKVPERLAQSDSELRVVYLSPITQAQRFADANAILQFINDLSAVANVDPAVLDVIDFDAMAVEMADIRGVPEKILRPEEEVKAIRENRVRQQQQEALSETLQNQAQAAPVSNGGGGGQGIPATIQ